MRRAIWEVTMEENEGSFVAVRRLSHGSERSTGCHSSPAEAVTGSTAWLGRGLSCVCAQRRDSDARLSFDMTPSQEECLLRLQYRIEVTYDGTNNEHQDSLKSLWYASFPGTELLGLISDQWKEMGWQGKDPSTDFRGGGYISLENLLFFAKSYPRSFQELLKKQNGVRALWEYPFAVAGVNITFMLIQMLDLQAAKPRTLLGAIFLKLLSENECAFDVLYCIAFKLMDQQWLAMHASYMDFNSIGKSAIYFVIPLEEWELPFGLWIYNGNEITEMVHFISRMLTRTVMKSTRNQLEQELLMEDVQRIEDMPSYRLLSR